MTFLRWLLVQRAFLAEAGPIFDLAARKRGVYGRAARATAIAGVVLLALAVAAPLAGAQELPVFGDSLVKSSSNPRDVSVTLQVLGLMTILTLAPSIFVACTSFVRIFVVFNFIKRALSVQEVPPAPVVSAFAIILTFLIMKPTFTEMKETALIPYMEERITFTEAYHNARIPLREFMFDQTRESDLRLFLELSGEDVPEKGTTRGRISTSVVVPAFMVSEMRRGFEMGFALYLPFLVIDMVVASTLISMGMMVLPPIFISLPFKLLLFVIVDGWAQLTKSVVLSFKPPPI
ncbi:MAG: flagellar type III secretion system pore protein FliP [Planctomycetes bacterium]|nr:flagellar type III secretion system pore protein FliP [Planctomycetota bacterium]